MFEILNIFAKQLHLANSKQVKIYSLVSYRKKNKVQCREAEYLCHPLMLRIFWGLGNLSVWCARFCIFGPHPPTQQMNSHFFGEFTCGRCGLVLLPPI